MNTFFLIVSKLAWILIRPETLVVLLFVLPLVLLKLGWVKQASGTLTFALAVLIGVGLFPLGHLLLGPLEKAYPAHPDIVAPVGIIVLGGMEDEGPDYTGEVAQINDAGDRLIAAIELARAFPRTQVLFTGGKLALKPVAEGEFEIGPEILRRLGLPETRLLVEGRSRSTAENAVLSRAMAPNGAAGTWVLVTSARHMPRSLGTFCAAGWQDLIPYPVDYRGGDFMEDIKWNLAGNLETLNMAAKEWIGLLAYRITARTELFFPVSCSD
ncbi:MAG: YdcF family protein [Pseudomonadota bacterium]